MGLVKEALLWPVTQVVTQEVVRLIGCDGNYGDTMTLENAETI